MHRSGKRYRFLIYVENDDQAEYVGIDCLLDIMVVDSPKGKTGHMCVSLKCYNYSFMWFQK